MLNVVYNFVICMYNFLWENHPRAMASPAIWNHTVLPSTPPDTCERAPP